MGHWTIKFLSVSVMALATACTSIYKDLHPFSADTGCLEKFKPVFQSELYSAVIDAPEQHHSGLLLIKQMDDASTRFVFTNEAGIKFFDFEFGQDGTFKVIQIIPRLNKALIVRLLQKDFESILMLPSEKKPKAFSKSDTLYFSQPSGKRTRYFITDPGCVQLLRIEEAKGNKRKTIIKIQEAGHHPPESVLVNHPDINLTLRLQHIKKIE